MTSKRDDPSRSSRIVRAVYRLVRTNRLPLEARLSTNSCSTRRRPGKLSNVRSSRNSSSRNVAGSPAALRARAKKASVASKAPRAPAGAPSLTGNGAVAATARRKRSGVVAVRSTSMYCADVRPRRSRSCCSSVVRPLPHPPTSTGIRDGEASSAATMRRVRVLRGVNIRGASTGAVCAKTKDRH